MKYMAGFEHYLLLDVHGELLKISYYFAENARPTTTFFPKMAHKYEELEPVIDRINELGLQHHFDYKEIIYETDKVKKVLDDLEEK